MGSLDGVVCFGSLGGVDCLGSLGDDGCFGASGGDYYLGSLEGGFGLPPDELVIGGFCLAAAASFCFWSSSNLQIIQIVASSI